MLRSVDTVTEMSPVFEGSKNLVYRFFAANNIDEAHLVCEMVQHLRFGKKGVPVA